MNENENRNETLTEQISVTIRRDVLAKLDAAAKANFRTRSSEATMRICKSFEQEDASAARA